MPPNDQTPAIVDPAHAARLERRQQKRRERRRRQQIGVAATGLVIAVATAIAVAASGGSPASKRAAVPRPQAKARIIPGGPLAPAKFGGLAALWAPANVVGYQPGTAAAYRAASARARLPGYLLIADRGNNRVLIVDPRHKLVFRYPTRADLAAGHRLIFNDDTFVEPGGRALIANEEENHAIVKIDLATRSLQVLFGHPGHAGAGRTHLHTPDDAYALPDGSFTVADAYNCRILFINSGRIVRKYGRAGDCRHDPPKAFGPVNGDTPEPNGGVLVSEIPGNWIDEIGPQGRLSFAVKAPVSYPSDPQPLPRNRILVADYANPGHVLIIDRAGRVLWRYGPEYGPGRLNHPSLAMALPNGDIAVNDDFRDRVVVIDPRIKRIVWQYGHTDAPGARPGFLNTPDGMDFVPAGPTGAPDFAAVVHP